MLCGVPGRFVAALMQARSLPACKPLAAVVVQKGGRRQLQPRRRDALERLPGL